MHIVCTLRLNQYAGHWGFPLGDQVQRIHLEIILNLKGFIYKL